MLLIDHVGRLKIALGIAWGAAVQEGLDKESPAFDHFLKSLNSMRATLCLLGLERKAKQINLEDYLSGKAGEVYSTSAQPDEAMNEPA